MFLGTDFSAFSCLSGGITFTSDETGNNITAVYSYGGNATLVNGLSDTRTIDELYDFLKANLFNGFNTLDGTAYISDINLVIGNASDTGSLASPTASLTYTCSRSSVFSSVGGFLDLLGTTVGGALSMRSQTGYSYSPGKQVVAYTTVLDADSRLVSATVSAKMYYPNTTLLTSGVATAVSTGRFLFAYSLPLTVPEGTYTVTFDANYLSGEVHDTIAFLVEKSLAPLNILATVGSIYSPGDEVIVYPTITNSNGNLVNATVNVSLYYPNATLLNKSSATEQALGRYRYNVTLPYSAPVGTYEARLDASYSNDESHYSLSFVVSSVLQEIFTLVNNTNTTLDTINTKIDIINMTVNDIKNTVNIINSTVTRIGVNVTSIHGTLNTVNSTVNNIDSTVALINSTANIINSNVTYMGTLLENINSSVHFINSTIVYINSTVTNINTTTTNSGSTITLINSTIYDVFDLVAGKLSIDVDTGSRYAPGDNVNIVVTATNSSGGLINASVDVEVFYPNATRLNNGSAQLGAAGRLNYSFPLDASTPLGTYRANVDANYSANEIHKNVVFLVATATAAVGGAGGLPLNIYNDVGKSYAPGDTVYISSNVVNSSGSRVNATVNITVYYPSGSEFDSGGSTEQSLGRYEYSFEAPATEGTYSIDIDANYSGNEIHDTLAFVITTGTGGSNATFPPQVIVDAPSTINIDTKFDIIALTKSSSGLLIDCTDGANITIRNTLNSTNVISNEPMSKFSTGLYNYTWSTGTQATYLATVTCSKISAIAYTGAKEFSTQNVAGATGGGGAAGGLPLNMFSGVGSFYSPGDNVLVVSTTTDNNGSLIGAMLNVSLYYPNATLLNHSLAVGQTIGRFRYNFALPLSAPIGSYEVRIDANYSGNEAHDSLAFVISSVLLEIFNVVNNTNTTVNTISQTVDVINTSVSNIDATVNVINSTVNRIDANITSVHGTLNTINSTVNLISSTVMDINSTVIDINSTTNTINSVVTRVDANVTSIQGTVNSIQSNITFISTLVENINSSVYFINSTIVYINSTVTNINTTTTNSGSTITLINSTVYDVFDLTAGRISIDVATGSSYAPGDNVNVVITAINSSGALINASVDVEVFYPNSTRLNNGSAQLGTAGRFNYSFPLDASAPLGTYRVNVDANYSSNSVHKNVVFEAVWVENPEVVVDAPAVINTGVPFDLIAMIRSAGGSLVDCSDGANITVRNTLNKTDVIINESMTNFGLGLYNYTWSTGAQSTYLAIVTCNKILSKEYVGVKEFSTQNVAASGVGGGGGSTGALPLNMFSDVGGFYSPGDDVVVVSTVMDNNGSLVGAMVNITLYYPNTTLLNHSLAMPQAVGRFRYNFTLPLSAPIGTYEARIDANYTNDQIHDSLTFVVSSAIEAIKMNVTQMINQIDGVIVPSLKEINLTTQDSYDYLLNNIFPLVNLRNTTSLDIKNETASLLLKWGTYNAEQLYNISNVTYNNSQRILSYIGTPSDDESANTLFGEFAYTKNRISDIDANVSEIKRIAAEVNVTSIIINSTISTVLLEVDDLEELHQCAITPNSTLCTLLNDIKLNTQNIYSAALAINTTTSALGLFTISSLVAGSPRYANENVLVEASFTTQNGSFVAPDSIVLTIFDSNSNKWANATLTDFTESSLHVWKYSKSLGANPTTGMYTVHLLGSYGGVNASKTTQFRVATGGPYMVFLDCPLTATVGQDLNCNVRIQDEGEAATESTCDVWVDSDGDTELDAGEPQTQFSKKTTPLQNVTQSVSINVPSTYANGLSIARVSCSYANSAQPDSTASDSVTFEAGAEEAPTTTGEAGGGGGGGGGGAAPSAPAAPAPAVSPTVDFQEVLDVQYYLQEGSVITFSLDGVNVHTITLTKVGEDFVILMIETTPIEVIARIGEPQKIDLENDGVYDLLIRLNDIIDGIADISIERIKETVPGAILFDVKVKILPRYMETPSGSSVAAEVSLYHVGGQGVKDTEVEYMIKNAKGEAVVSEHEIVGIENKLVLLKEISIPKEVEPGEYVFFVEMKYNQKTASGAARFNIVGKGVEERLAPSRGPSSLLIVSTLLLIMGGLASLALQLKKGSIKKKYMQIIRMKASIVSIAILAAVVLASLLLNASVWGMVKGVLDSKEVYITWVLLVGTIILFSYLLYEIKKRNSSRNGRRKRGLPNKRKGGERAKRREHEFSEMRVAPPAEKIQEIAKPDREERTQEKREEKEEISAVPPVKSSETIITKHSDYVVKREDSLITKHSDYIVKKEPAVSGEFKVIPAENASAQGRTQIEEKDPAKELSKLLEEDGIRLEKKEGKHPLELTPMQIANEKWRLLKELRRLKEAYKQGVIPNEGYEETKNVLIKRIQDLKR